MLMGIEGLLEDRLLLAPSTSDLVKDTLLICHVLLGLAMVRGFVLCSLRDHLDSGGSGSTRRILTFESFESVCKKELFTWTV